jgi:glutamate dehydrogenase
MKDLLEKIESLYPNEANLKEFCKIFLGAMSPAMIDSFEESALISFLKERFDFFKASLKKDGEFRVTVLPKDQKIALDWSYPDAAYSMDSIENIIKLMGARVYRRVFRSIGVKSEKGELTSVHLAKGKEKRNVIIYMELYPFHQKGMVEDLSERLRVNAQGMSQAIKDAPKMIEVLKGLIPEIKQNNILSPDEINEWVDFANWMENNFFFMGYSAFEKDKDIPTSGLGVCAQSFREDFSKNIMDGLTFEVFKNKDMEEPCYFGNIRASNPVRKSQGLMRVCIRTNNKVEHNFLGFVRSVALNENILDVPVLRARIKELFENLNIVWESYSFNKLLKILSLIPKTDLFKTPVEELQVLAKTLLRINLPNQVHCIFYHQKIKGRFSLYVLIPKDRLDAENYQKIIRLVGLNVHFPILEVVEAKGSDPALMHFHFEGPDEKINLPSSEDLSKEISDLVKPWGEAFEEFLIKDFGEGVGEAHAEHFDRLIPSHYRDRTYPEDAAKDIRFIENLSHKEGLDFDLVDFKRPGSKFHNTCSLVTIYSKEKIDLIKIMPIMKNLGLYVFDQLVSRIGDMEHTAAYIGSFRVVDSEGKKIDNSLYKDLLGEMIVEVLRSRSEDDYINTLVLRAKLNFREINVLALYRNLYLQMRPVYDRHRVTAALSKYPQAASYLIEYFNEKFSVEKGDLDFRLKNILPKIKEKYLHLLSEISVVAEDIILRSLFTLIEKTVRTNYFVPHTSNETTLSVKILSQEVDFIPNPKPYREIYVHDANMEGTHLRFGPIARGGIRWSDRGDDFRTEVLGLVHTQTKKNVVIVPTGSKGGFFIKRLPGSHEEIVKESKSQYQRFIHSLLQITDNMDVSRKVFHPQNVVCYDGLDPYLVVAADKGTATFSDFANAISMGHKFWLGDGFASGGSAGYDHKKEAITARGAYECTKIHFLEKGKNIEKETFTLAGIGDMAGDVFGNGMLLCKKGLLKAAFNHVHIFLDPNPDLEKSYLERKRLFELPRSSWMDYNTKLISQGGGIFSRSAKTIVLTPEVKAMLGVSVDQMTGEEIITAILKMPVELFWFGGIGTYIRASIETNSDAGDKANDNVRITAPEMGAQVIAEGANLGITQKARLELSKQGISLNTDAIDNSAGVNMSDYEVNIKILLNQLLNETKIKDMDERNKILASATNQVSDLVLANNRGQHRMISMDKIRSSQRFRLFTETIDQLVEKGLNPTAENIPKKAELANVEKTKKGLARPLISALSAYVKMEVSDAIVKSDLIKDPFYNQFFKSYFPALILEKFAQDIDKHPLKSEIISTVITNKVVNQAGIHFFHRAGKFHSTSFDKVAHNYLINEAILDADAFRKTINSSDILETAKYEALIELDELLKLITHFSLRLTKPLSVDKIPGYSKEISEFKILLEENKEEFSKIYNTWKKKGFSEEICKTLTFFGLLKETADVFYFHEEKNISFKQALNLSYSVNQKFQIWYFFNKIRSAEATSDWENELKDILIMSLESSKFRIVDLALLFQGEISPMISEFEIGFNQFFETMGKIKEDPHAGLTALSVCVNGLNFVGNAMEIKRKEKNQ